MDDDFYAGVLCERCECTFIEEEKDVRNLAGKKVCIGCFEYFVENGVDEILRKSYVYKRDWEGLIDSDGYRFDDDKAAKEIKEFVIKEIMGVEYHAR